MSPRANATCSTNTKGQAGQCRQHRMQAWPQHQYFQRHKYALPYMHRCTWITTNSATRRTTAWSAPTLRIKQPTPEGGRGRYGRAERYARSKSWQAAGRRAAAVWLPAGAARAWRRGRGGGGGGGGAETDLQGRAEQQPHAACSERRWGGMAVQVAWQGHIPGAD